MGRGAASKRTSLVLLAVLTLCLTGQLLDAGRVGKKTGQSKSASGAVVDAETADTMEGINFERLAEESFNETRDGSAAADREDNEWADEDQDSDTSEVEASGASRSVGGKPVNNLKPEWLGLVFLPHKDWNDRKSRLAGYVIYINRGMVLAYRDTCGIPEIQHNLPRYANIEDMQQIEFDVPNKYNVLTSPEVRPRRYGCDYTRPAFQSNNFGVYTLLYKRRFWQEQLLEFYRPSPPVFQNDSSVHDTCFLYTYSGDINPNARWPGPVRTWSRLLIYFQRCDSSGMCIFASQADDTVPIGTYQFGQICPGMGDFGAPIMCGPDQKLSYLVAPTRNNYRCTDIIFAWRVADHYKELERLVNYVPALPVLDT